MSKTVRHAVIRELLARGPATSQDDLRRQLARRGIAADQATISRDAHELGLVKTPQGYALPDQAAAAARPVRPRLDGVMSVQVASNLVILKTPPGLAQPVAIELDRSGDDDVVGTVAGDDTVFIATRNARAAKSVARRLRSGANT